MPDRYGEPNEQPVVDFDSRRKARENAAAAEAALQQRQRLNETRAVHAPLTGTQSAAARNHRNTVTSQADAHRNKLRIANCTLCNNEGYTATLLVCDHIDHAAATEHGRALVRDELAKIRERKGSEA